MIYDLLLDTQRISNAETLTESTILYEATKTTVSGPPISFKNLLRLYDYLYANGYSGNLGSAHNSLRDTNAATDKTRDATIKGNLVVQQKDAALIDALGADDSKYYPYSHNGDHMFYMLTLRGGARGMTGSLYFAYLSPNDLPELKTAVKQFYVTNGLADEATAEEYVNMWQPETLSWSRGAQWTGAGKYISLPFTITDPGSIPPSFKQAYRKVEKW